MKNKEQDQHAGADNREWVPLTYLTELMSISAVTAKKWIEEENLTCFQRGKTVRVVKAEVDAFINRHTSNL